MHVYCSPDPAETGDSSYVNAMRWHLEEGNQAWANAFYTYWPGDIGAFNTDWQSFVTAYPAGLPVLASPKGDPVNNGSAVTSFMTDLQTHGGANWLSKWVMAYWQEPGQEIREGTLPLATYQARVSAMADLVRPFGARNAPHIEEWDINPFNSAAGSTEAERFAHVYEIVDGIEDKLDYFSWSLYPAAGKDMRPGIDRIEKWMNQYLPGLPFGITAASSPVPLGTSSSDPARATRANLVRQAGDHILARYTATGRGPDAFGWFHFYGFGTNDKDNLAADSTGTVDQQLLDALNYVAALDMGDPAPDPDPDPPPVSAASWAVREGGALVPKDAFVKVGGELVPISGLT